MLLQLAVILSLYRLSNNVDITLYSIAFLGDIYVCTYVDTYCLDYSAISDLTPYKLQWDITTMFTM